MDAGMVMTSYGELHIVAGWIWIAAIAALAISAYMGQQQGKADKAIADYNASVSERDAAERKSEAEAEAKKIERQGRLLRGSQAAAAGGAGITQSGSVLDIIADDAMETELKRQEVLRGGKTAERANLDQAALQREGGKRAAKTGILKGFSQGVGTAGSIAASK